MWRAGRRRYAARSFHPSRNLSSPFVPQAYVAQESRSSYHRLVSNHGSPHVDYSHGVRRIDDDPVVVFSAAADSDLIPIALAAVATPSIDAEGSFAVLTDQLLERELLGDVATLGPDALRLRAWSAAQAIVRPSHLFVPKPGIYQVSATVVFPEPREEDVPRRLTLTVNDTDAAGHQGYTSILSLSTVVQLTPEDLVAVSIDPNDLDFDVRLGAVHLGG